MRRRILMCLAVLLLLSGMGAASASDVLAAQSEALDLDALQDAAGLSARRSAGGGHQSG